MKNMTLVANMLMLCLFSASIAQAQEQLETIHPSPRFLMWQVKTKLEVSARLWKYESLCEFGHPKDISWPKTWKEEESVIKERVLIYGGCRNLEKTLGHPEAVIISFVNRSDSTLEVPVEKFSSISIVTNDGKKFPAIGCRWRLSAPVYKDYVYLFARELADVVTVMLGPNEKADFMFLFPVASANESIQIGKLATVKIADLQIK